MTSPPFPHRLESTEHLKKDVVVLDSEKVPPTTLFAPNFRNALRENVYKALFTSKCVPSRISPHIVMKPARPHFICPNVVKEEGKQNSFGKTKQEKISSGITPLSKTIIDGGKRPGTKLLNDDRSNNKPPKTYFIPGITGPPLCLVDQYLAPESTDEIEAPSSARFLPPLNRKSGETTRRHLTRGGSMIELSANFDDMLLDVSERSEFSLRSDGILFTKRRFDSRYQNATPSMLGSKVSKLHERLERNQNRLRRKQSKMLKTIKELRKSIAESGKQKQKETSKARKS